ncbi:MAG: 2-succinyl-6-hydroxy-2,4-cyclohexadiene-1-carboxylate synthase [Deltaproteobacteria bacterium]|nr:2-succinyl-6-hydroxy-2,4-cyclohexadiene-1-carboxylate synthase [Deltaproteobacteria bacterium]
MSLPPVLYYKCRGNQSAPPIVFLHGFMGSGQDWAEVIDALSDRYYCLTIDLPGHGRSLHFTDDRSYTISEASLGIVGAMNKAGISPAPIVGYSMGGRLALSLAIHHRHVCSRLIVESATAGIVDENARAQRLAEDEKRAMELEQGEFEDFLRTWYRQPIFASLIDDEEKLEDVLRQRRKNKPAKLAKALRGMSVGAQAPLWEFLPCVNIPVLLVAGEQDGKYKDIVKKMATSLPRARVEIVSEAGHNAHMDRPSVVARLIDQFLS